MKSSLRTLKTVIPLVLAMVSSALAASYNAFADFSVTNGNPNGAWSYGWSATLFSSLNLYTSGVVAGDGTWNWSDPNHIMFGAPAAWINPTANQVGTVPSMTAAFHPGVSDEFSHYIWTAPTTGLFSLSATFSPFDTGGTDVHILDNGVSLFAGNVSPGNPQSFSTVLPVVAGDKIDFAVGFGPDGSAGFDTTGISAIISEVPEPATTSSFIAGIALLGGSFYFRRRRLMR